MDMEYQNDIRNVLETLGYKKLNEISNDERLRLLKIGSDLEEMLGNESVVVKTKKGLFVYTPPKENDTRDEK